ncbi:MAG: gamma-glutamyltransferase, partial [Candidatus Marinimicrobia bacterium]|nr:gamma-glutamyltransferase [Candidatus Neomarinimicrobiota bacterium]
TLIAPAADLAENGYAVGYQLHSDLVEYEDFLKKYEATAAIFYPKSRPLRLNALFKQPDLAATLRRIAADGADEFYEGETAGLIVRQMNASGGLITMADLANYQAVERPAVEFDYRDVHVITMGPPSGGGIALAQILNQLERVDVPDLGYHSAGHVHAMAEAQKRAFADRTAYLGDPDFIKVPVQELISDDYAARRWGDFSELWATPGKDVANGDLAGAYESEYTTHFSVVDRHGNAVSVTTTINGLYGCGVAVAGAGFLLNNEMDDFTIKLANRNMWSLVGGVPNLIEPGKRMLSSMTPTIVTRDDKLMLVTGSPGGGRIITTVAQVISNLVDYEMDIKQAIDAPRIHHQWLPDIIQTERFTLSRETRQQLARMGHVVQERDGIIGAANSIYIDPANNWKHGAFDSRREAGAAGY